jgi:uncharacterized membrane protein YbhN (UPF0104 family)
MTSVISVLFLLAFLFLGVGIFYWLRERERKREAAGLPRLATWRLVFASAFALIALFSGGCSLLFVPDAVRGNQYIDPTAVLVIGGIPFAVAVVLLWLFLLRGKS